jgi:glycosyltransferase involved in cell wall biosynthesis
MRIVQVAGWYYPENIGGTEMYVATLSRLLIESGAEVVIAAPLAGIDSPRSYVHDGIQVFRYPVPTKPTRDEAQGRAPARGSEHFREWIADAKPDVAHFHSIVTGLGMHELSAARNTGAKIVFTSHASSLGYICQRGTLMRLGEFPCDGLTEIVKCSVCELQHRGLPRAVGEIVAREPLPLSRALGAPQNAVATALGMPDLIFRNKQSQQELLALVDKFVVLTRSAAGIVLRNGALPEKLAVNPLGIAAARFSVKAAPEINPTRTPVRLGYLGRFDVVKGVIELAAALRALPAEMKFVFEFRGPVSGAGEREVFDRVKEMCSGDDRIAFKPGVPAEDVPGVLASYDVLVCPSVCAEGGPTVAIEAHAVGTPVIGTRIGGLPEIVHEGTNGSLVEPADVNALTSMLRAVISAPAETIDRWRRALPAPRTMTDVARDYLDLYGGARVVQ